MRPANNKFAGFLDRGVYMVKGIMRCCSLLVVSLLCLGGYVIFIERQLLRVEHVELTLREEPTQALKVVQFTDTHVGEFYSIDNLRKAVEKIQFENPDLIVFTGDLFDNASQYENHSEVFEVLSKLEAPLGCYAVYGNRDYGGGAVRFYESEMEAAGFSVLVDEKVSFEVGDETVSLFGTDDYVLGSPDAWALVDDMKDSDINLLLTHEPDAILNYYSYPIDVAFAGHSHGGQVSLPVIGPLFKTNYCETYFKGLYTLENERQTMLFVSSGLGNTKIPIRFMNIPEIVSFTLKF